ncbi:unnamed protein product [Rhizoctonia solani]|uniref:Uncharacterized protein n=1 Tax=Rhizoctonia solani TaxID=456999 RepID=A0A8H2WVV8_9AGAM|nr:unnamed protein product [Rhizoctonia solani]
MTAPLKLTFHGGLYMGITQKAIFTFVCDPTAAESSEPVLLSHGDPLEDQGNHKLTWSSKHACPMGGHPDKQSEEPPNPTVPAPDPLLTARTVGPGAMISGKPETAMDYQARHNPIPLLCAFSYGPGHSSRGRPSLSSHSTHSRRAEIYYFTFLIGTINPQPLGLVSSMMSVPTQVDFGLHRVHVLVAGAAGGIGIEIVQEFLKQGAYVTAQYHNSIGSLPELQQGTDNLELFKADVTDEHAVRKMFSRGGEFFEQEAQVLIVNHGMMVEEEINIVDMELAQWEHTMKVNLTGAFLLVREFLRRLRKPRRKFAPDLSKVAVVLLGSTSGEFGEAGYVDYACSKSALQTGFLISIKNEIVKIAPAGRINAVSPGWVLTPKTKHILSDPEYLERTLATVPLRKVAQPIDVARQVLVLASSTFSGHLTGQNIVLSGGMEGQLLNLPGQTPPKHEEQSNVGDSSSAGSKPRKSMP